MNWFNGTLIAFLCASEPVLRAIDVRLRRPSNWGDVAWAGLRGLAVMVLVVAVAAS